MSEMKRGYVKSWNVRCGYGFIVPDDGSPELWFHASAIVSPAHMKNRNMTHGQLVEFETGMAYRRNRAGKRPVAYSVRPLKPEDFDATPDKQQEFKILVVDPPQGQVAVIEV